jgi:hypothetical protein
MQSLIARIAGVAAPDILVEPRPPLDIQSNRLFDVFWRDQHWIAKEYLKPDEFTVSPVREFKGLTLLADLDIAPQPVHFEPHRATTPPIVIYEYMPGEMWDRTKPSPTQLRQLADIWLLQASFDPDRLWMSNGGSTTAADFAKRLAGFINTYTHWVEANFPAGKAAAALADQALTKCIEVASRLDSEPPPLCFNQTDTRFANVIQRPDNRPGLIDWEDCGLRDAGRNMADLVLAPNQEDLLTFAEWQAFLDPVIAVQKGTMPSVERRFRSYLLLTSVFWLGLFLSLGTTRQRFEGWEANGLPVARRLQRYLARALAYPSLDFTTQLSQTRLLRFFPDTAAV